MLYLGWFSFHPPETRHTQHITCSFIENETHIIRWRIPILDKQIAAHKMLFVGWNLLDV